MEATKFWGSVSGKKSDTVLCAKLRPIKTVIANIILSNSELLDWFEIGRTSISEHVEELGALKPYKETSKRQTVSNDGGKARTVLQGSTS